MVRLKKGRGSKRGQGATEQKAEQDADGYSDARQQKALPQNHFQHIHAIRSEKPSECRFSRRRRLTEYAIRP